MKVQKFDGKLSVTVKQEQKDGSVSYLQFDWTGAKSLSANVLAGTIAKEIFRHLQAKKACGLKDFKTNRPLEIVIKTDGYTVVDTARVDKKIGLKFTPRTEDQLGINLFTAITFVRSKMQVTGITNEKLAKYVESHDMPLLERSKKEVTVEGEIVDAVPVVE